MVIGTSYISPRKVLQASTPFVRWQVIATTGLCIAGASITLTARADDPASLEQWGTLIPIALSLAAILINAGMLWQQLNETKRRLELLEQTLPLVYARKDVILEQFQTIHTEIVNLRKLLELR